MNIRDAEMENGWESENLKHFGGLPKFMGGKCLWGFGKKMENYFVGGKF